MTTDNEKLKDLSIANLKAIYDYASQKAMNDKLSDSKAQYWMYVELSCRRELEYKIGNIFP